MAQVLTGVVKWFNNSKAFGFIVPDEIGTDGSKKDIFVHQSNIDMPGFRTLAESQKVSYELGTCRDGRSQAVKVKPQ